MGRDPEGVRVFPASPQSRTWAKAAWSAAKPLLGDPDLQATWLQCEGTWFVGVDVLPNAKDGSIGGVALPPEASRVMGGQDLHQAQVSAVYPGFPKPRKGESEAAFRYRQIRFGAHVDGLTRTKEGARVLSEPHACVLGIALTDPGSEAGPLMVWPGSQAVMGQALRQALDGAPSVTDVSHAYAKARRCVFETIEPRPVHLAIGDCVVLHRHLLHGMGPWNPVQNLGNTDVRAVAYFRPLMAGGAQAWLSGESTP